MCERGATTHAPGAARAAAAHAVTGLASTRQHAAGEEEDARAVSDQLLLVLRSLDFVGANTELARVGESRLRVVL
jgi:hypothetical protein